MTAAAAVVVVAVEMKRLAEELYHIQHSPRGFLLLGEWYEQPEAEPLNVAARPLPYGFGCMDSAWQKMMPNPFQQIVQTCNDAQ